MGKPLVSLIRVAAPLGALLFIALMVAIHGVRALALLGVLAIIWAIAGTRSWQTTIALLTRLTGSRRGAYAALGFVVIAGFAAINIYQAMH